MSLLSRLPRSRLALLAAVVALGVAVPVTIAQAAPGPVTIPVTITNNTGAKGQMYVYVLGVDNTNKSADNLGYVDGNGTYHKWPAAASVDPVSAPDVAIPGPADGSSTTIKMPVNLSGRIYYSIGSKLDFKLVKNDLGVTGLVQPAPWSKGDANAGKFFDWTEFTLMGQENQYTGLWINSTQVDQVAIPAQVTVKGSKGSTTTGTMLPGGMKKIADTLKSNPATAKQVVTSSNGSLLRILASSHATREGLLDADIIQSSIDKAWKVYESKTLVVQPFTDQPNNKFYGKVQGGKMVFTDAKGAQAYVIDKPTSVDVFECAGTLVAPNDLVAGPIARSVCADLNRGVLDADGVHPIADGSLYYKNTPTNEYAKVVHSVMKDGNAYAFAFDDVGNHESLVYDPQPTSVNIVLQPLDGTWTGPSDPTSPTPSPSTSAPTSPTPTATTPTTAAPTATPTATSSPSQPGCEPGGGGTDPVGNSRTVTVTIPDRAPGYAYLDLGAGTKAGVLTVVVKGGSASVASVDGPGRVRVNLSGPKGPQQVTITSTANLGTVQVTIPS